jgi:hypothetical protein
MAETGPIGGGRRKPAAKLSGKRGIVATIGAAFDLFCRFLPPREGASTRIEREQEAR